MIGQQQVRVPARERGGRDGGAGDGASAAGSGRDVAPRDLSRPAFGEVLGAEIVGELPPVDLAPTPAGRDVLEAEVVTPPPPSRRWLLDADLVTGLYPTVLRGATVTDPVAVTAIRNRVAYARLVWWRKLVTRRPAGYRTGWR